ncbi:MAG: amidohydrolase family protein [Burkholderiales bacterium]
MAAKQEIITLEEHYWDKETASHFGDGVGFAPRVLDRLYDYSALRVREMDEAGIDIQVLSHGSPSTQRGDAQTMVSVARGANDRLAQIVKAHPTRFAAFAQIPTPDPEAAADELERCVDKLGFVGAMVHGPTNGLFLDDKRFWPIFERAEKLDVPIYIHPSAPKKKVVDAYYKDYLGEFPGFATAGWGFGVECATQAIRLVLSGVLDQYPGTRIIVGHMGEGIPFMLWRIDHGLLPRGARAASFSFLESFTRHFWITTSANFYTPALLCSVQTMGVDRILFSVDYPFITNRAGADWIPTIPLGAGDMQKILSGNARKLLKLK